MRTIKISCYRSDKSHGCQIDLTPEVFRLDYSAIPEVFRRLPPELAAEFGIRQNGKILQV
jgi:hypothetical protein